MRKKDNPTQGTLQAIFGVGQTSVCRYLKVMDRILASVLPTAKNVSKEIAACKTGEEFKRMAPGPGGGDVTADGMTVFAEDEAAVQRSQNPAYGWRPTGGASRSGQASQGSLSGYSARCPKASCE